MSLETGTWLSDLVAANPLSGDKKKQGDDHLRLIKAVLQATFPNASKAFYFPTTASKTVDFAVLAGDLNKTFVVDTTAGAVTATLPTLGAGDAGWECSFIKSNTSTNAYFIAPPSGTIQSGEAAGLVKTRRCIPGHRTKVLWSGTAWIAERVVRHPIGAVLDVPLAALPVGYEWANGQTLSSSANYPDYNSVNGGLVVPERRAKSAFGRTDMGGVDVGGITNAVSGIVGTTLGASGGAQSVAIARANLPDIDLNNSGLTVPHVHTTSANLLNNAQDSSVTYSDGAVGTDPLPGNIHLNGNVTRTDVNKMPPAIITNFVVVVE